MRTSRNHTAPRGLTPDVARNAIVARGVQHGTQRQQGLHFQGRDPGPPKPIACGLDVGTGCICPGDGRPAGLRGARRKAGRPGSGGEDLPGTPGRAGDGRRDPVAPAPGASFPGDAGHCPVPEPGDPRKADRARVRVRGPGRERPGGPVGAGALHRDHGRHGEPRSRGPSRPIPEGSQDGPGRSRAGRLPGNPGCPGTRGARRRGRQVPVASPGDDGPRNPGGPRPPRSCRARGLGQAPASMGGRRPPRRPGRERPVPGAPRLEVAAGPVPCDGNPARGLGIACGQPTGARGPVPARHRLCRGHGRGGRTPRLEAGRNRRQRAARPAGRRRGVRPVLQRLGADGRSAAVARAGLDLLQRDFGTRKGLGV